MFTPQDTEDYEALLRDLYVGPCFDGPVEVFVGVSKQGLTLEVRPYLEPAVGGLQGDLDNYVKAATDALNGVAYLDDKQVVKITAVKL